MLKDSFLSTFSSSSRLPWPLTIPKWNYWTLKSSHQLLFTQFLMRYGSNRIFASQTLCRKWKQNLSKRNSLTECWNSHKDSTEVAISLSKRRTLASINSSMMCSSSMVLWFMILAYFHASMNSLKTLLAILLPLRQIITLDSIKSDSTYCPRISWHFLLNSGL